AVRLFCCTTAATSHLAPIALTPSKPPGGSWSVIRLKEKSLSPFRTSKNRVIHGAPGQAARDPSIAGFGKVLILNRLSERLAANWCSFIKGRDHLTSNKVSSQQIWSSNEVSFEIRTRLFGCNGLFHTGFFR